ncbi:MAG TPA: response regulator [Flavisolibacter sp.]|nr:response regulator [Flavisolibacter sp.]
MSTTTNISPIEAADPANAAKAVVLLIEDDCDDADFLVEAFHELSPRHEVVCFTGADKLFSYLNSLSADALPCLIITDLNIPVINGIAILNMLTEDKRYTSIPKIVYSHSSNPHDKESSFSAGALTYIKKPNTIAAIKENVKDMLGFCR